MDDLQEELAGSWVEDKDSAVDRLCGQVTLKCLQVKIILKSIIKDRSINC